MVSSLVARSPAVPTAPATKPPPGTSRRKVARAGSTWQDHLPDLAMFGRKIFSARVVAKVSQDALPWHAEGVVVFVQHGRGTLRWVHGPPGAEVSRRSLMLGTTPLLQAESDDWCPTCEKLLALGMGREHVAPGDLEALRQVSNRPDVPLESAVGALAPLLQLLEDGVYLVSRVPHAPTNGEGLPFWALSPRARSLRASRDWYFSELGLGRLVRGFPAFLLPTQALDRCDWAAVDEYRRQLRSGQRVGGLALWAEGFLSALLDGHHRATAALLEGVPLDCLTVMTAGGVELRDGKEWLIFWRERIAFADLPREAVRVLERRTRGAAAGAPAPIDAGQDGADEPWKTHPRWADLAVAAGRYLETPAVAALEVVGDTSDERIERLLDGRGGGAGELWLVLQVLIASKDPRAVGVALRVGRAYWPDLWGDAFRFLATTRSKEVEDFFIEFLVRDEGQHPWLEQIADAYLASDEAGAAP